MEGNSEQAQDNTIDNVEPRGEIEYQGKDGSMHFFHTPGEMADFIAQENDRDNR